MKNVFMHTLLKAVILTLLIQLISSSTTLAQGKWTDGYIVTNQNDTIRGLIKDEGWTESPEAIHFQVKDLPAMAISAANTKAFGIVSGNDIYKSKK